MALHPTFEMLRLTIPFLMSTAALLSGYDLMKRTGLAKQTCYDVAHRLADEGWFSAQVERANLRMGMPPRTLYQITPKGLEQTRAALALLQVST